MRGRRSGAIVNISSIAVPVTPVGSGYFSAAKAAIEGITGALRGELAPLGISVTGVEPGAFRTDFAGRSLAESATLIDDYAATAGQRRKEHDTMDGNQAGDPAKAGAAIIAAVESPEPPAFLLLGADALAADRYIADGHAKEIAQLGRADVQHCPRPPERSRLGLRSLSSSMALGYLIADGRVEVEGFLDPDTPLAAADQIGRSVAAAW